MKYIKEFFRLVFIIDNLIVRLYCNWKLLL